jgi:hypothetical protein
MPAKLVDTVRTKCSQLELISGFVEGWLKQFGEMPSKKSIGVIYAQNTLETGGSTSMWNYNIGNVKFVASKNAADDDGKMYMMLNNVWEMVGGKKIIFQPPHPATWFRAFDTLADGVAFHFNFLKNKRYKTAWSAVESGDPAAFAHLLRVAGYYTAPEADYVKLMNFHFNKYMKETIYEDVVAKLKPAAVPEPETVVEPVVTTPDTVSSDPVPLEPTTTKTPLNAIQGLFSTFMSIFNKK